MRAGERPGGRRAVLLYALGWILSGTLVVGLLVLALDGDDAVELGPVQRIELREASAAGRCALEELGPADRSDLPVSGPRPPRAAAPGEYERSPAGPELVGAVRRGIVVVVHTPGLVRERRAELTAVQRGIPAGTIVAPRPRARFEVAAVAWRRALRCPRLTPAALDAVRLFQARFVGTGPDSAPG